MCIRDRLSVLTATFGLTFHFHNTLDFIGKNICIHFYRLFEFLFTSTFIQYPPITERALKPVILPVFVSCQSLMGTREVVSLIYL